MRKCNIGGEALIEGVMMKSPDKIAMAVRKSDGEIVIEKKQHSAYTKRFKLLSLPIVRGVASFIESMVVGIKALTYSAELFDIEGEGETESSFDRFLIKLFGDKLQDAIIMFSLVIALVFGVGLFMLLPNFIAGFLKNLNHLLLNVIEGVLRLAIFFGYIVAISKMKDIQRVFQYHGAEHKTIHCFENEQELTVENVKRFSRLHPRCGTSFLFIVMIISIIVFLFFGWPGSFLVRVSSRILLVPLIAGISYEVFRFAGTNKSKLISLLKAPGLALQFFTTREPDDSQIEVAIAALKGVIEEKEDVIGDCDNKCK